MCFADVAVANPAEAQRWKLLAHTVKEDVQSCPDYCQTQYNNVPIITDPTIKVRESARPA